MNRLPESKIRAIAEQRAHTEGAVTKSPDQISPLPPLKKPLAHNSTWPA